MNDTIFMLCMAATASIVFVIAWHRILKKELNAHVALKRKIESAYPVNLRNGISNIQSQFRHKFKVPHDSFLAFCIIAMLSAFFVGGIPAVFPSLSMEACATLTGSAALCLSALFLSCVNTRIEQTAYEEAISYVDTQKKMQDMYSVLSEYSYIYEDDEHDEIIRKLIAAREKYQEFREQYK